MSPLSKLLLAFCSLFIISFSSASAQSDTSYRAYGVLADEATGFPIDYFDLRLVNTNTNKQFTTTTDSLGRFIFQRLPIGSYALYANTLLVKDAGFKSLTTFDINNQDKSLAIVKISTEILRVSKKTVTIDVPAVTIIGDTTMFNASSFKVNGDASVEDLLTKMPGVTVSDGKVSSKGEEVKRVLIDGKPSFGSDPSTTLKNMPAEMVDRIQVYDGLSDKSKFSGIDDGNTQKTINIITKPGMKNGVFGRLQGGYGTDNRYKSSLVVNGMLGSHRFMLLAQSNNINEQNFAIEDLVGAMGGGGGGMRSSMMANASMFRPGSQSFMRGGPLSDFTVSQSNGLTRTNAIGFNYGGTWGKKLEVSGSYFYNKSDNEAISNLRRQFLIPNDSGLTQEYLENNLSASINSNHRVNMRFEYNIDTMNALIFTPSLSFQDNVGSTYSEASTQFSDVATNLSTTSRNNDLFGSNLGGTLLYRHRFLRRGRTLTLGVDGSRRTNDGTNDLLSLNTFYKPVTNVLALDQESSLDQTYLSYSSNFTYTEPVSDSSVISLEYENSFSPTNSNRRTFNYDSASFLYTLLDTVLSSQFQSDYTYHKAGMSYDINKTKYQLTLGLQGQTALLNNEQTYPYEDTLKRTFQNFLPNARLRYSFSRSSQLNVGYRTRTNAPSITQLQDVLNNSNPLQLSIGNPDLKQEYSHTVFTRFSTSNPNTNALFFGMLFATYTQDYIGNETTIATSNTSYENRIQLIPGAQISKPINLDGNISLRGYFGTGFPIKKLKSNLNLNIIPSYSRIPGMINGQLNTTDNPGIGAGFVFSSNISSDLDFTLSSMGNYSQSSNSLQSSQNQNNFNTYSRFRINWIFYKKFFINADVSHNLFTGLSSGFNQNYTLFNASIGKKFLPMDLLDIRISAFDILNQNTAVSRSVNELYIEDMSSNVLTQYFMVIATLKLAYFKGMKFGAKPEGEEAPGAIKMGPPRDRKGNIAPPPH